MTPSLTLPGRKLARPTARGGLLRSGLQDVEVARPSPSRRLQTIRFAPPLFQVQISKKIRWFFWLGRAHARWAAPEWSKH